MATHTVAIDVIDISIPEANHKNIPIINKPNRCYGYNANAKEVWQLIQLSRYNIYEAGTNKSINGNNYYDYFPEEEGGGGGGGVTPADVQNMITASIDAAVSSSSTNAIQNKVIKEYVDTGLNSKADTSSLADVATSGDYGDLINPPTVDSSISTTSTNAVQNSTITNFVNSSIETATAEFKGTFETKEAMNAVTGNKNDYAFLIVKNADGTVNHYERYKWVVVPIDGSNWVFEYNLNNSSYTAEQWAAINSGIKSTDVSQIETNKSDISNLKNEKVDKIDGKDLSTNDFTDADKDQISTNQTDISSHIGNKNNPHEVTKSQVGLGNVDNTSDLDKPISTATQAALNTKFDTAGTGLNKNGTTVSHATPEGAATHAKAFYKFSTDALGHVNGVTEATEAEVNAINSGITATKVSQIETNKNNISKNEAALIELVDGGAKNKLNTIAESTTISGITITVNSDYSITLNGTANDSFTITVGQASLENDSYVLSGCPIDGNITTNYALQLLIYKSITVGPLTFAEPYLKAGTTDKFILKNTVVIDTEKYDIVKNGYVYYTSEGEPPKELTLENEDATLGIKVVGKPQATYSPTLTDLGYGAYLRPYVIVKDKTTNVETTIYIDTQYISAADFAACQDVGNTTTIAFTNDETYGVQIAIAANYSVSDLTFYPMICTKAAWNISHAYQPHRSSYQELTEQIETNKDNILLLRTFMAYVGYSEVVKAEKEVDNPNRIKFYIQGYYNGDISTVKTGCLVARSIPLNTDLTVDNAEADNSFSGLVFSGSVKDSREDGLGVSIKTYIEISGERHYGVQQRYFYSDLT